VGYEWQTVALFATIGALVVVAFIYAHFTRAGGASSINLWDLVKDDGEGSRISGRKATEFGGFLAMTAWLSVEVIRGTPSETLLLGYATLCIAGRVAGQVVNLKSRRLELDSESKEIWDVQSNSPQVTPRRAKVSSE
jgi:hypothetical protein